MSFMKYVKKLAQKIRENDFFSYIQLIKNCIKGKYKHKKIDK